MNTLANITTVLDWEDYLIIFILVVVALFVTGRRWPK